MATTNTSIEKLYTDVVASLLPFYSSAVLLPGEGVLTNVYNIEGAVGEFVRIPVTQFWNPAASGLADGASIKEASDSGNANVRADFAPEAVTCGVTKRGAGTSVSEEALEDGGMDVVRNAVITRISNALAQSTDIGGFREMFVGSETAPANATVIVNGGLGMDGVAIGSLANVTCDASLVMSPDSLAHVTKRSPTVKVFEDVDRDRYDMVATMRNGFKRIPYSTPAGNAYFARGIVASGVVSEADANLRATLEMFSTSVANLRSENAATDASGFYLAMLTPAHEFHIASQLNGVTVGTGAIGDLSIIGNQALRSALIGQAVGCTFIRSNNLPRGLNAA